MACNPFDSFRVATEYLPDVAFLQGTFSDIFTNFIRKSEYVKGTGFTHSSFTIGRSMPTDDEPEFLPITDHTGATFTGTCGDVYNPVEWGMNEITYSPEQIAWSGPIVCQDDLIFAHKAEMFLEAYIPSLAKHIVQEIANRMLSIYIHFSPKGAQVGTSFSYGAEGSGPAPRRPIIQLGKTTCQLSQDQLDYTAVILNQEGAFAPNTNSWITLGEDGPIYPMLIGQEASQAILLQNAELRQDRRWADSGKGDMAMLFQRIGATRVIKNFRHIVTAFPARYTYNAGTGRYVRTPTWIANAATKGTEAEINPAWSAVNSSPYEAAVVLNPWVFESQAVRPVNSAAGLNWSPKNYMGELEFKTGGSKICDPPQFDPQEKLGKHFGSYKHAARPIFPKFGRVIIFKRCSGITECISCVS